MTIPKFDPVSSSALKAVLPSKRSLVYYLEYCRVLVSGGCVATAPTAEKVVQDYADRSWACADLLQDLATAAGLVHDIGKAMDFFQEKLCGRRTTLNYVRHEWVSARLIQAYCLNHLERGASPWGPQRRELGERGDARESDRAAHWLQGLHRDGLDPVSEHRAPLLRARTADGLRSLDNISFALTWLALTHHRLPRSPAGGRAGVTESQVQNWAEQVTPEWNERRFADPRECEPAGKPEDHRKILESSWSFSKGLPMTCGAWDTQFQAVAARLGSRAGDEPLAANTFVVHMARLCLMLGDHAYSGLGPGNKHRVPAAESNPQLWANTTAVNGTDEPNQGLEEHLRGVGLFSQELAKHLPDLRTSLPALGRQAETRLRKDADDTRFAWQDEAARAAERLCVASARSGAFVINAASTGKGKTIANARILAGLSPHGEVRATIALGLRTLTLQTSQALASRLGLSAADLVTKVGGCAQEVSDYQRAVDAAGERGSESAACPSDADLVIGAPAVASVTHPVLRRLPESAARLVGAPVLVCTIDHLMPATESLGGGDQMAPMLRLLTSDLVLDEPDEFGLGDLPALTRLVRWAAMLGSRVILSSATINPALAQGLYAAYCHGRREFEQATRGAQEGAQEGAPLYPPALWVDESEAYALAAPEQSGRTFEAAHLEFMERRASRLSAAPAKHRGEIGAAGPKTEQELSRWLLTSALAMHERHRETYQLKCGTAVKASIGLVRLANVRPLIETAQHWLADAQTWLRHSTGAPCSDVRIHLCVYHSRYPLLLRSAMEKQLDAVLSRHAPQAILGHDCIKQHLEREPDKEHVFVVLGSPVTEVGRDHDYDWAVVEPSSMRSLIQIAGRVRRHRPEAPGGAPNLLIAPVNFQALRNAADRRDGPVYCRPGFESDTARLAEHASAAVLRPGEVAVVNAIPRILEPSEPMPRRYLGDLEHSRTRGTMLPQVTSGQGSPSPAGRTRARLTASSVVSVTAASCWSAPGAPWSGLLPQAQPFRAQEGPEEQAYCFDFNREGHLVPAHARVAGQGKPGTLGVMSRKDFCWVPLAPSGGPVDFWFELDLQSELCALAEHLGRKPEEIAARFTEFTLATAHAGVNFHPQLGAWKQG